ncbi:MAG: glutaredoxin domain-containing protein [bacterium]
MPKARSRGPCRSLAACVTLVLACAATAAAATREPCDRIELWSRAGCPHCADARRFLDELRARIPGLEVEVHDVVGDAAALASLRALAEREHLAGLSVPTFSICGAVVVGYQDDATSGSDIEALVRGTANAAELPGEGRVELPWLGAVRLDRLGLPLFTVVIGLVDGFNPCAMWVLLFLLSILVNLRDRRKIALIAGTFVVVSGLAYFAFMAAWLNVFLWVGLTRTVQVVLGLVALVVGSVHVKDFVRFGRGPSLSIPASAKPGIYARVRRIVNAESTAAALLGAITLAVLVNLVELLCTAGLPALYTQILGMQHLTAAAHYGYLALYNVAYVADDTVMLGVVVVTLSRRKLEQGGGRWLKLLSGAVILVLGLLLIVAPHWLTP